MKKVIEHLAVMATGLLFTYLFAGDAVQNINHRYFAGSGDGAKDYYATFYHIKHDSGYLHSSCMNYPFGESIFFAGSQPMVSSTIKFISQNIYDISPYTVAIHNLLILLSIALTALAIHLIFRHLNLPIWYSLVLAVGLTFLSPQINRLGGHFALSYTLVIPLFILLILKFDQKRSLPVTILTLVVSLWASITHGYFFTFYMAMIAAYWLWQKPWSNSFSWKANWLHIALQVMVPLILVPVTILYLDPVEDRTTWPWGFLVYRAYPESVFLSPDRRYWSWLDSMVKIRTVPWEGIAYVGMVSVVGFAALLFNSIKKILKREWIKAFSVTDMPLLNQFFWLSVLLLLFSFGIPFIFRLEFLLEYLGPIRQFRGIGRFAWLFFYMLNIVVFYLLWQKMKNAKSVYRVFVILPLAVLAYDAWFHSHSQKHYINNRLPELDYAFHAKAKPNINVEEFQTIMPIPFFSIGSENYWREPACNESVVKVYAFSQFTGLPLNATYTSRSSVWRCVENLNLVMEPLQVYPVLNYYSKKDILLLVDPACDMISQNERRIVSVSTLLDTIWGLELRRLTIDELASLHQNLKSEYLAKAKLPADCTQTGIFFQDYENDISPTALSGKGALKLNQRGYTNLFNGRLPGNTSNEITIAFWVSNMKQDIVPRNRVEIVTGNEEGKWEAWYGFGFMEHTKAFYGSWALVEYDLKLNRADDFLCISVAPLLPKSGDVYIDSFLIRPTGKDVVREDLGTVNINNRPFELIAGTKEN